MVESRLKSYGRADIRGQLLVITCSRSSESFDHPLLSRHISAGRLVSHLDTGDSASFVVIRKSSAIAHLFGLLHHILNNSLHPLKLWTHVRTSPNWRDGLVQSGFLLWVGQKAIPDRLGS